MEKESDKDQKEPTKRQLTRQMERTRESLAETVGEIKETVEMEVSAVKQTVAGVLDYREEFKNDPLVWSLGALSAGFALGYTVGYAHKNSKGSKQKPVVAFADDMIEQLSTMGKGLVLPALNDKIGELFGIDFSGMLDKVGTASLPPAKTKRSRKAASKPSKKTREQKKK
ncbi:MAG: hypothetical protein JO053_11325 [Acidobacteria bacterium]|nr:hypothetical protein [Acidobacteriota bacterium]